MALPERCVLECVEDAFIPQVGVDERRVELEEESPGVLLAVTDGARYLHVTCAWQLIQTFDGRTILARLRAVAERLGCHAYNPQTEELRPAITPKAYATSPAASSAERSEIEDASEEDMRRAQSLADTDRASSMGTLLEGVVKRRIIELSWRSGFIEGATFRFDGDMLRQPSRLLLPRLSIKECRTSDALALELASAFGEEALDLRHQAVTAARKKAVADRKASSPAAAPAPPTGFTIAPGARVKHAKFGGGTIVAVEGPEKIVVRFDDGSEKKLAPKFVSEP